jgi:hypothetical protein
MNTRETIPNKLHEIRTVLLSAIAELDLRGTDQQITKVMCIIDATFESAISGKSISSVDALKQGMALYH